MFLETLEIHNFGKLKNCKISWQKDKLNVAIFPNEWGKSTIFYCLISLFYGVEKNSKNSSTPLQRQHYLPLDGEAFSEATLHFTYQDVPYYLYRRFGKRKKDDLLTFYRKDNLSTITLSDNQEVGEFLFSLNKESFLSILAFSHEGSFSAFNKSENQEIKDKLTSLGTKLDSNLSIEEASANLASYLKILSSNLAKNSLLKISERKLQSINEKIAVLQAQTTRNEERKQELINAQNNLSQQKIILNSIKEIYKQQESLLQDRQNKQAELFLETEFFEKKKEPFKNNLAEQEKQLTSLNQQLSTLNQKIFDNNQAELALQEINYKLDLCIQKKQDLLNENEFLHKEIAEEKQSSTLIKEEIAKLNSEDEQIKAKLYQLSTSEEPSKHKSHLLTLIISGLLSISFLSILFLNQYMAYISVTFCSLVLLFAFFFFYQGKKKTEAALKADKNEQYNLLHLKQNNVAEILNYKQLSLQKTEEKISSLQNKNNIHLLKLKKIEDEIAKLQVEQKNTTRAAATSTQDEVLLTQQIDTIKAAIESTSSNIVNIKTELQAIEKEELAKKAKITDQLALLDNNLNDLSETIATQNYTQSDLEEAFSIYWQKLAQIEAELIKIDQENINFYPLEEEKYLLEVDKKKLDFEIRSCEYALKVLEEVQYRLKNHWAPQLLTTTSPFLNQITKGRYTQLQVADDFSLAVFDNQLHQFVAMDKLSRGTLEQIYLAMRLAVITLVEPPLLKFPCFFDDPFVHYDNEREQAGLDLLIEQASVSKRFIFICTSKISPALNKHLEINAEKINILK